VIAIALGVVLGLVIFCLLRYVIAAIGWLLWSLRWVFVWGAFAYGINEYNIAHGYVHTKRVSAPQSVSAQLEKVRAEELARRDALKRYIDRRVAEDWAHQPDLLKKTKDTDLDSKPEYLNPEAGFVRAALRSMPDSVWNECNKREFDVRFGALKSKTYKTTKIMV
jgi:hypothetical protein